MLLRKFGSCLRSLGAGGSLGACLMRSAACLTRSGWLGGRGLR